MGHALNHSVGCRQKWMRGFQRICDPARKPITAEFHWTVVEKSKRWGRLNALWIWGREAFTERFKMEKYKYGARIISQPRRLGCS